MLRHWIHILLVALFAISLAGTTACGSSNGSGGCCKICSKGKPCGDSCISKSFTCRRSAGCACAGTPLAQSSKQSLQERMQFVDAYLYEGPSGLKYESGSIIGFLSNTHMSIELETGLPAMVFWGQIYLGQLDPPAKGELISFENNLTGHACVELSTKLIYALIRIQGSENSVPTIDDLKSMGFPQLATLTQLKDIRELATNKSFLKNFGVGLELYANCVDVTERGR